MPKPVIRLRDVTKSYGAGAAKTQVLRGVSFDVDAGEFVALVGQSGSGKSTLLNIIGGLDSPDAGEVEVLGIDTLRANDAKRAQLRNQSIGFVFQAFNLLARTSAVENVELPLIYSSDGHSAKDRAEKARHCLEIVGLKGREDHLPSQLSGGQQQRVAIARALINDPKLILADEPTGNLDTRTSEEVMAVFQDLNEQGKTVVVITHEQDISEYAKRVVVFRDGKLVEDHPVVRRRAAAAMAAGETASR
jgi:putative ABC transport system ATP-binding protein